MMSVWAYMHRGLDQRLREAQELENMEEQKFIAPPVEIGYEAEDTEEERA